MAQIFSDATDGSISKFFREAAELAKSISTTFQLFNTIVIPEIQKALKERQR